MGFKLYVYINIDLNILCHYRDCENSGVDVKPTQVSVSTSVFNLCTPKNIGLVAPTNVHI